MPLRSTRKTPSPAAAQDRARSTQRRPGPVWSDSACIEQDDCDPGALPCWAGEDREQLVGPQVLDLLSNTIAFWALHIRNRMRRPP